MDVTSTAQILAALGVGTFIAQYLSTSHERRKLRADVLRALLVTERARWYDEEGGAALTLERWLSASRELKATALIAGVPAGAVNAYLAIADVARRESEVNWSRHGDDEIGPFVSNETDALVQEAAKLVTDLTWAPRRTRVRLKTRIKGLETKSGQLQG